VQTDCSKFQESEALIFSAGYLYVAQPAAKNILILNRETLDIVKTIDVPGSECGGNCHPFGIAINEEHKVMAIAAQSKTFGGESKVMMFKIKGNLKKPSTITIDHYYTMPKLINPPPKRVRPDVRGVAFCGHRFAYADFNGVIYNWRMRWDDSNPEPAESDRYDMILNSPFHSGKYRGKQYYIGCSNSGEHLVVEKTMLDHHTDIGVGAVPCDPKGGSSNIWDIADIVVKQSDWHDLPKHTRMNQS